MNSRFRLLHIFGCTLMASLIPLASYGQAQRDSSPRAGDPFAPEVITALMREVNDYQVGHPVMKGLNRNWERGTWFTGVMAAGQATGDESYIEQAMHFGQEHQWQPGTERSGGNKLTCTQTYLELYFLKTNRAFIEPLIQWLNAGASNTPSGAKVWYLEGGVRYADSLYVGAPPLAMLAKATGDAKYLDWMNAFFWDVHAEIFDPAAGLFYRDKRFIGKTNANGKKVFWSRGNGWVLGSLPRILSYLPANDPSRPKYEALFKQMATAIAKQQQPDGLWRPNLGDSEEFFMPETSGSGFFCYGIAWGIRNGVLDRAEFLPVVRKAWAGLVSYVSPEGRVQWGQLVGDRPAPVQQSNSHEYVTGTFLLAGSEVLRLVKAGVISGTESKAGASSEPALLPPAALTTGSLNASAYLHADKINLFLDRQQKVGDFQATGLTRGDYLRVLEGQVRAMRHYQDGGGRIIDPVEKAEKYFATPCYAHAVAALAASGHTKDQALIESGMKALDVALRDMAENKAAGNHGDFFTWPAMFAYELFQKSAASERKAVWAAHLQAVEPKKLYKAYLGRAGNWTIVNTAGEFFRHRGGFTSLGYVEDSLMGQRPNFTPLGQYNEGGNPFPYDHFPRHYLAGVLHLGYRGAQFEAYREWLWRGAWTSLFIQSPFGELPTGYRSSHHIWNEAEQCVTFELLARAYAEAGRPAEAGAFKRAAHLSLGSIKQWIRPDGSGYIVKNRYPIEARHGYEGYSAHTCYNLLACSMLAQAWQFADDSVKEKPAPADVGGFVVPILTPFHKIFANAGGTYVEYDTSGDHVYNPTGLIRVHVRGAHPQLGPSDGCATRYSGTNCNIAVGPGWQDAGGVWRSLAEMSPQQSLVEVLGEQTERASFRVTHILAWTNGTPGKIKLAETIVVEPAGVTVTDDLTGDIANMRVTWPMLVFDGAEQAEVQLGKNTASLRLGGRGTRFTLLEPTGTLLQRAGKQVSHRNGMMEPATAEFSGKQAVYRITALPERDGPAGR